MQRLAVTFRVRPEAVEAVQQLLSSYDPPEPIIDDETRLVSTSVFMKDDGLVIRMIEFEGEFPKIMKHLSQDPQIQFVERELDKYLVEEDKRDMSTPDGARMFFLKALMKTVTTRIPEGYAPSAQLAK